MKTIELKQLGEKGKDGVLNYSELIKAIMQSPGDPQKGLGIEEIRQSVKILDVLDESKKTLTLEDADYNVLKNRAVNFKYSLAHKNIITFVDDIENAKEAKK